SPELLRRSARMPPHVLLLVHGTFSSTRGSFAALANHESGRALLSAATNVYDAVLGYDHRTLSLGAADNARDLAARLGAMNLAPNTRLDAVAYSRRGLVYRVFA